MNQNPIEQVDLHSWIEKTALTAKGLMASGRIHGFKPFYVNRRAFQANCKNLMVLGINPAGGSEGERAEQAHGYINRILNAQGGPFCSITDGENGEQGAENQRYATRVRAYIASLLGWERPNSRDRRYSLVPLGNINPFRFPNVETMDEGVWDKGVNAGIELISLARPKFLLLIGTGDGRSTWGVIRNLIINNPRLVGMDDARAVLERLRIDQAAITVPGAKQTILQWEGGQSTQVIALAHPRVPITNQAYDQQLKVLSALFPEWKTIKLDDPYLADRAPMLTKLTKG